MKTVKLATLMACMALAIGTSEARAAFLSVTPTGSFDAQAATSVSYDLLFNVEPTESFSFIAWDLNLQFDAGELTNWTAANLAGGDIAPTAAPGMLNFLYLDLLGTTDFITVGPHLMATVSFNIIGPPKMHDGISDFEVLSQIGTIQGFATMQDFIQLNGAAGADVGAVPIPGAVWLFGSGLVGLFGLKRKAAAGRK